MSYGINSVIGAIRELIVNSGRNLTGKLKYVIFILLWLFQGL